MGAREVNRKLMGKFFLMSFFMHGSGTEIAIREKMSDTGKEISKKGLMQCRFQMPADGCARE